MEIYFRLNAPRVRIFGLTFKMSRGECNRLGIVPFEYHLYLDMIMVNTQTQQEKKIFF